MATTHPGSLWNVTTDNKLFERGMHSLTRFLMLCPGDICLRYFHNNLLQIIIKKIIRMKAISVLYFTKHDFEIHFSCCFPLKSFVKISLSTNIIVIARRRYAWDSRAWIISTLYCLPSVLRITITSMAGRANMHIKKYIHLFIYYYYIASPGPLFYYIIQQQPMKKWCDVSRNNRLKCHDMYTSSRWMI